jgi:predicted transcriptional regulator
MVNCVRADPAPGRHWMKVRDIVAALEGILLTGEDMLDVDIEAACGADLMSDVMAFVKENVVLLTGLVNPQSIRTADLMDIRVVVFVRGKMPPKDMIAEAQRNGMAVIATKYSMFLACGRLYEAGIRGGGTREIR